MLTTDHRGASEKQKESDGANWPSKFIPLMVAEWIVSGDRLSLRHRELFSVLFYGVFSAWLSGPSLWYAMPGGRGKLKPFPGHFP